jgi:hypothetical protein
LWLLDARPSKRSVELKTADHLTYRYATILNDRETYYDIDVVTERYFAASTS